MSDDPVRADDGDRDCSACDTSTPSEWDPVLRVFVCPVCATMWRRRVDDDAARDDASGEG